MYLGGVCQRHYPWCFQHPNHRCFFRGTIEMQMILITSTTTFAAAVIYISTGPTATTYDVASITATTSATAAKFSVNATWRL